MPHDEIYLRDRFIVHPGQGSLDVAHEATIVLRGATAGVVYRHDDGKEHQLHLSDQVCDCQVQHAEAILTAANKDVAIAWHIGLREHTILSLSIVNRSRQPLYIDEMTVLLVDGGGLGLGEQPARWRFYQNGWQSWSPSFTRPCVGRPASDEVSFYLYNEPDTTDYRQKHLPHGYSTSSLLSDCFTVIKGERASLLAGFITTAQNLSAIRLAMGDNRTGRFTATCAGDGVLLPPGGYLTSESLLLEVSSDPLALLDVYMDELAAAMRGRVAETVPTGWCTWYYYYGENGEDDVLANVAAIKEKQIPLQYILQDDGYQAAIGDWLSCNARFRHGIPWLAEQIRAAGFRPAIWLAPFGVAQNSRLYAEHPDWVLTDSDGQPLVAWRHAGVEAPILALDCTHPQVQNWLATLFHTMADEWGIEMFKIDFCFAAALPGRRYDPTATRAMALRRGLEVIRQAIGERFLLGCGLPLGPAVGIVDGMRISTDVAVTWHPFFPDPAAPATRHALLNTLTRFAGHKRLWLNDPDCVIARDRSDENNLKLEETRTLVTLMGLSGGMIISGDNITTLRPARLRYLQQLLPPSGQAAIPLDLFEHDLPYLLVLPCSDAAGQYLLLAAVNWQDRRASITIDTTVLRDALGDSPLRAWNLSAGQYMGLYDVATKRTDWVLDDRPAHSTTLVLLKRAADQPDLLVSTFHLLGGLVEVKSRTWQGHRLTVELEKPGRQRGSLVFTVPEGYRPQSARVNGRLRTYTFGQGILTVNFTLADRALVDIVFAVSTRA